MTHQVSMCKAMPELGLVLGLAAVSSVDKMPFLDQENDNITQAALTKGWRDYMGGDRTINLEHGKDVSGQVVFCWPLEEGLNKAVGIDSNVEGILVGVRIDDPAIMKAFVDKELTGFSMEGAITKHHIEDPSSA